MIETIPAKDLKPLPDHLYPRMTESEAHIDALAKALREGDTLPSILVDSKRRVVDGYHRWKANCRAFGDECSIVCEVRQYQSEKDLFFDAVRENARHGLRFSSGDLARQAEIRQILHRRPVGNALVPSSRSAAEVRAKEQAEKLLRALGDGRLRQNRIALESGLRKLEVAIKRYLDRGQTAEDFEAR